LEIARKAMEMEAEMEANMTPEERRQLAREREEADATAMTNDLFGAVDALSKGTSAVPGGVMMSGDKVVMKDLKDHLRHAKKVGECIQGHGKITLCSAFLTEVIQQCKDVLDDDAITEIIKSCNVIKNEKVQAAKRVKKGQAQKSKKADKQAAKKAMENHKEAFGESNQYDEYDEMGDAYEDKFL
jgi:translation initiation factor 3 subunit J